MGNTLYKDDIIAEYASVKGITLKEAKERIEGILEIINYALVFGYDVKLNNFFNFYGVTLKEKSGINPVTKEPIKIEATRTIRVKMTKPLKRRVQNSWKCRRD